MNGTNQSEREELLRWLLQRNEENPQDNRRRRRLLVDGQLIPVLRLMVQNLDHNTAEALKEFVTPQNNPPHFPVLEFLCQAENTSKCYCPICEGEKGVHFNRLIRLTLAAALAYWDKNGADTWLGTAYKSIFGNLMPTNWGVSEDGSGRLLLTPRQDQAVASLTKQRLAILSDILYQLGGTAESEPTPSARRRASLVLVQDRISFLAQVEMQPVPVILPPIFYPAPELLLATNYDEDFAQQLKLAWEKVSTPESPPHAVRWRLFNYLENQWVGGSVSGGSAGAAFYVALRSLVLNGPAPNFRYFISAALSDGNALAKVSQIQTKAQAWNQYLDGLRHDPQLREAFRFYVCPKNFQEATAAVAHKELVASADTVEDAYNALTRLGETVARVFTHIAHRYNRLPLGENLRLLPSSELTPLPDAAPEVPAAPASSPSEGSPERSVFVPLPVQKRVRRAPDAPARPQQGNQPAASETAPPPRDPREEEYRQLAEQTPEHRDAHETETETMSWDRFVQEAFRAKTTQALIGAPGAGKSTAARVLTLRGIRAMLRYLESGGSEPPDYFAFLIPAPLFAQFRPSKPDGDFLTELLLHAVRDALGGHYEELIGVDKQQAENALHEWLRSNLARPEMKILLLIDGVDEVPELEREAFTRNSKTLHEAMQAAQAQIALLYLIRTLDWETRRRWIHDAPQYGYECADLTPRLKRALIERFFGEGSDPARALNELLAQNYALMQATRTPLLMTLICLLYEAGNLNEATGYAELYRLILLLAMESRWRSDEWRRRRLMPILEQLGMGVHLNRAAETVYFSLLLPVGYQQFTASPRVNRFTHQQWLEACERAYPNAAPDAYGKATLALEWLQAAGLVSYDGAFYTFAHRSFLEFLAGAYLARLSRDEWEPILRGAGDAELVDKGDWGSVHRAPQGSWWWFAPEYAEAIAFMASAMEDATPLLEAIEAEERKYPREVFRHLLIHKARVAGYGKVKEEKRTAIVQEVARLYFKDEHPPRDCMLPALRGLGKYAVDALRERLQDKNEDVGVRCAAAEALGEIGGEQAVDALMQLLQDTTEQVEVRVAAARALGQISDEQSVNFLIQLLQHDINARVLRVVAQALGTIGSEQAVKVFVERLQDTSVDVDVRRAIAWELERIASEQSARALIERLQDRAEDTMVRRAAAWALGRIGSEQYVNILTERLQDRNENVSVRCAAAEALGENGGKLVLDTLTKHLRYRWENRDVRYAVVRALGMIDDERALDALIQILQDRSEDMEVRGIAAGVLVNTKNEMAVNVLIERLRDRSEDVYLRCLLADALQGVNTVNEQAANALIECLQDQSENREVRRAVAETLDSINLRAMISEQTVDVLVERLQDRGEDEEVRCKIAKTLAQFSHEKVISALTLCWQDNSENWSVRFAAGSSLPQSNDISDISSHLAELRVSWQRRFVYRDLLPICRKHRFIAQHSQRRFISPIHRFFRSIRRLLYRLGFQAP